MSKKKDRAWFICPQWAELTSRYYPSDETAARSLRTNPKVLGQLRQQSPVARSTLAALHAIETTIEEMIVDTRSR